LFKTNELGQLDTNETYIVR